MNLSQSEIQKLDAVGRIFLLSYWAEHSKIVVDGKLFSFKDHEYLIDIYQDNSPIKVFKKGAQLGLSTFEILSAIHGCNYIYPTGVLYLFPTEKSVSRFSKGKFDTLIRQNPDTIGAYLGKVQTEMQKEIGPSMLYFAGSRTRDPLKTVSVDKIIFDEFDEMQSGVGHTGEDQATRFDPVSLARERYSHSEYKHEDILGTPLLPDYGIEAEYLKTDQKHWMIKCDHCGKYTCLELTFPDCLKPQLDGRVIRACSKCGREINPSIGVWDALYPNILGKSGYYVSQLVSKFIDPKTIYDQYMSLDSVTPLKRQEFWNSKMGMGYVEIQDRLTKQQVYELCDAVPMRSAHVGDDEGTCCMGVDQGDKLHVTIGKRTGDNTKKIIHLGHYKNWEELDNLMTSFNVWRCVVDAQPEMRNARSFANRHAGRVFLNFYNYRMKGVTKWNYNDLRVEENRTESLDNSHNDIMYGLVSLPRRSEETEEFAKHAIAIAKKLEEDPESGSKEYNYIKLGADHYRHSYNYFCIASQDAPISHKKEIGVIEKFRFKGMKGEKTELCNTYH